jgi:hypothetical protein
VLSRMKAKHSIRKVEFGIAARLLQSSQRATRFNGAAPARARSSPDTEKDFVRAGQAVNLTAPGRKRFFQTYEQRMSSLITHPPSTTKSATAARRSCRRGCWQNR